MLNTAGANEPIGVHCPGDGYRSRHSQHTVVPSSYNENFPEGNKLRLQRSGFDRELVADHNCCLIVYSAFLIP